MSTTTINSPKIREAFQPHADSAAEWFTKTVRDRFAVLADDDGTISKRNASFLSSANYSLDRDIRRLIRPDTDAPSFSLEARKAPRVLDEDALELAAHRFGRDQVASFVGKLEQKLERLEDVQVVNMNTSLGEFMIVGTVEGHHVRVEQTRVFKTSRKGTLFVQFPARIYVDGKFTSEADFKAQFPN